MANKSYNEIVDTCLLTNYKQEFTGKTSVWVETWEDANNTYRALFTPTSLEVLPITYFTTEKVNDNS